MKVPPLHATGSQVFTFTIALLLFCSTLQREFGQNNRHDRNVDFYAYFFAAQVVHDEPSEDVYYGDLGKYPEITNPPKNSPIFKMARAAGVKADLTLYLYSPLLADMLIPMTRLSAATAGVVWQFLNISLAFVSAFLLSQIISVRIPSPEFLVLLVATYSFLPVVDAITLGQITILMLLLWAISAAAYSRGQIVVSACALAFASTLKVTPVLAVPLFLIWKDKKWLIIYFSAIAFLILAMATFNGWHLLHVAIEVMAAMGSGLPIRDNRSIGALVSWLYYGKYFGEDPASIPLPSSFLATTEKLVSLVFYGICLLLAWRRRGEATSMQRTMTLAIFALVSVLCAPVSWRHAYTVALLPLSLLWMQELRAQAASLLTVFLALTSFAVGSVFFDVIAGTHLPMALRLLSAGTGVLSSLLLCLIVLSREVRCLSMPLP